MEFQWTAELKGFVPTGMGRLVVVDDASLALTRPQFRSMKTHLSKDMDSIKLPRPCMCNCPLVLNIGEYSP